MIRRGTGTVNDCYPPVIYLLLFRAAPRRARENIALYADACLFIAERRVVGWPRANALAVQEALHCRARREFNLEFRRKQRCGVVTRIVVVSSLAFQRRAECCDNVGLVKKNKEDCPEGPFSCLVLVLHLHIPPVNFL